MCAAPKRAPVPAEPFRSYADFCRAQRIRGRKSGVVRRRRTAARDSRIRQLHREGWTLRPLGAEFGLHHSTIANIVKGRQWMMRRPFLRHPHACRTNQFARQGAPVSFLKFSPIEGSESRNRETGTRARAGCGPPFASDRVPLPENEPLTMSALAAAWEADDWADR